MSPTCPYKVSYLPSPIQFLCRGFASIQADVKGGDVAIFVLFGGYKFKCQLVAAIAENAVILVIGAASGFRRIGFLGVDFVAEIVVEE